MIKYIQKILIVFSLPFIYARYSFVLFLPLLLNNNEGYDYPFYLPFVVISLTYVLFFSLIGYSEIMVLYIKVFQKLTMVNFDIGKLWMRSDTYSYSHWKHPTLIINGKEIKISIAVMGGATYTYDYHLTRKAIFYTL